MNGWHELASLGMVVRPPDSTLPTNVGRRALFSARWSQTVRLLGSELRQLQARTIVLELDITERDLRIDGFPRAHARLGSQSVRISFESKHGSLRYETGEYGDWQDNVRAIALSLEALRAVDRYGVSKRGEQYRGWKALPTGTDPADSIATPEIARAFLGQWDGDVKRAIRETHPDAGGDPSEFRKVIRAKELVGA